MTSSLEVVQAFVQDVWSEGRLDRIPVLVDEDYTVYGTVEGQDFVRRNVLNWRSAFPDLNCTILTACADGENVAIIVRMTGTHLGDWYGTLATGRTVDIREAIFWRVRNGRLASIESIGESLKFRKQLGLLPEDA
jgi:predicted ester cyclase